MRLSAARLAHPKGESLGIFPDNIDTAVCRSAIDDDVFKIGVIPLEYGQDGVFQEHRLIVAWRNN